MAKVYVEARPKGRPENSPINDYVVEDSADNVLKTTSTQKAAIDGQRRMAIPHTWLAYGTSTTRRSRITGARSRSRDLPGANDPSLRATWLTCSVNHA